MNPENYSNETINAFVDGELDHHERVELIEAASNSDNLRQRICDAQYLKELVASSYPVVKKEKRHAPKQLHIFAVAASIVFITVLSIFTIIPSISPKNIPALSSTTATEQVRVVFHISDDNPQTAEQLVQQLSLVLENHKNQQLRVEVVANNRGLRLLQQGVTPVHQQIKSLHDRYPYLVFAACGNTMERLQKMTGEVITIIPEAVIIRSGVSYVTRRQQLGWSYIKV